MNIKKQLMLFSLLACTLAAGAHDFTVTMKGQRLFFSITSKANKTAEVTYEGSIANRHECTISGDVEIPSSVEHDDVVYNITGIQAKAFAGAKNLTGIVMPSGLEYIGNFAFEGCTSLKSIVFGSNSVKLGQGVFFKCNAIQNVSLGSDWKDINLETFRWSDSLRTLAIPAKIEKIRNMKSLKHLEVITVDANNNNFSAFDGALYSKDFKTLYGCPRAHAGKLAVKEGTEKITTGALIDCANLTDVDIPASVTTMSFREFSRDKALQSVTFHHDSPLKTAFLDGKGLFLLMVANPNVKINVPDLSKKLYKAALVQQPGEYKETANADAIAYQVAATQLPNQKNIIGLK